MSVTDQRNLILNINDSSIEQKRSIITKNDKVKINKSDEYHEDRKNLNN